MRNWVVGLGCVLLVSGCTAARQAASERDEIDCTHVLRKEGDRAGRACFITALARCESAVVEVVEQHFAVDTEHWERHTAWVRPTQDGCTVIAEIEDAWGRIHRRRCDQVFVNFVGGPGRQLIAPPYAPPCVEEE
mgnify:CR=1 FL=1